jgi:hypothetical protein
VQERYTVVARESGYAIATAGSCVVQLVHTQLTLAGISATRRALGDLTDRYDKVGFITVLEDTSKVTVTDEIRAGVAGIVRQYSPLFCAAAVVFEGQGFRATAVRSVVTALNIASRAQHPNRVFSRLNDGIGWVESKTARSNRVGCETLMALVAELRGLK